MVVRYGVKGYKATEEKIKKMKLWSTMVILGRSERTQSSPVQVAGTDSARSYNERAKFQGHPTLRSFSSRES